MPELDADFYFTQLRFHDYLECKRRFQLRYLFEQPWPAHVTEPAGEYEEQVEAGRQFHRLVHQYLLGLSVESLSRMAEIPRLDRWWGNFLEYGMRSIPEVRLPEVARSTAIGGYALIGKFDLIAAGGDGRVLIVDWKTGGSIPTLSDLRSRMQSRVYPYILAREGLDLPDFETINPAKITMRYWFAEDPQEPREFKYSEARMASDGEFMLQLVSEIESQSVDQFELTQDLHRCRFCQYRSLCDRGVRAGPRTDLELDPDVIEEWSDGSEPAPDEISPSSLVAG